MKKLFIPIVLFLCNFAVADDDPLSAHAALSNEVEEVNYANDYISANSYIQNPYVGMPSGGGTQKISESQLLDQSVASKWFTKGTWNVMGQASFVSQNGISNYGYGANLFGQTGSVSGFSFAV